MPCRCPPSFHLTRSSCARRSTTLTCPLTVKMRTGFDMNKPTAHNLIPKLHGWGAYAVTLHGRSRQQRYSKAADWEYISRCSKLTPLPFIG